MWHCSVARFQLLFTCPAAYHLHGVDIPELILEVSFGRIVLAIINGEDTLRSFTICKHWLLDYVALFEARVWLRQSQSVPPEPMEKYLLQRRSDSR
jgi:hypothetical protein